MDLKLARTRDEALLYLDLHPCERCGSVEVAWDTALVSADGELARSYFGTCADCGNEREYVFRVPEPGSVPLSAGDVVVFGGSDPSELLDAGEWLWVSDLTAGDVPVDDVAEARRTLGIAAAAIDETLKFLPAGEDAVPVTALWSERGRQVYAADPGRFERDRLLIARDTYRQELAGLGAGAAGADDRDGSGRFADPGAAEAARQRLRGWLRTLAGTLYPETEPLVEDDSGPVRSVPGPDTEPAAVASSVTVTTGPAGPPWRADEAVSRAARELAADGWRAEPLRHEGDRYEVVAQRDGYRIVVAMLQRQGILRLAGRTPEFTLPPAEVGDPAGGGAGWHPANDVEDALRVALGRGDRKDALDLLRVVPLYLPAPDDLDLDDDSDEAVPFWTSHVRGRVHLVAFTSPDALVHALGEQAEGWVETSYPDLVAHWPDPAWRLTVNLGTPVEVEVPVGSDRG